MKDGTSPRMGVNQTVSTRPWAGSFFFFFFTTYHNWTLTAETKNDYLEAADEVAPKAINLPYWSWPLI